MQQLSLHCTPLSPPHGAANSALSPGHRRRGTSGGPCSSGRDAHNRNGKYTSSTAGTTTAMGPRCQGLHAPGDCAGGPMARTHTHTHSTPGLLFVLEISAVTLFAAVPPLSFRTPNFTTSGALLSPLGT